MDNGEIENEEEGASEEEISNTPKDGKIKRKAREKYRKTIERKRLRAMSLGSLEEFL